MARSSYQVYLMYKASASASAYTKLVDIKDFPDMGGDPEMLDTTTLSDKMKTFIEGIQEGEALKFTANYTKTDFSTLKALEGSQQDLALWFGATTSEQGVETPSGSDGKFSWKGSINVHVLGAGVNEVINMAIVSAPSTVIDFA